MAFPQGPGRTEFFENVFIGHKSGGYRFRPFRESPACAFAVLDSRMCSRVGLRGCILNPIALYAADQQTRIVDMPSGLDIAKTPLAGHTAQRLASLALKTMTAMMITTIPMTGTGLTRAP
ncbi:MAG: hypothetical protein P4L64_07495 [Caulobacteraceae bacterium]|nr:hypothetical protein [Caulobacteraceae bacterium]